MPDPVAAPIVKRIYDEYLRGRGHNIAEGLTRDGIPCPPAPVSSASPPPDAPSATPGPTHATHTPTPPVPGVSVTAAIQPLVRHALPAGSTPGPRSGLLLLGPSYLPLSRRTA